MILVFAVLGWIVGILLSRVADALLRLTGRRVAASRDAGGLEPALVQWLTALASRGRADRLPRSLWPKLAIELFSAALFAYLWSAPLEPASRFAMTCLCAFLILVTIIDLRYRLVPNVLVFPAMGLTLLVRLTTPGSNAPAALVGGAFGFAIFAAVALVRPGELGGGDIKLATWIGFVFGFPNALWALLVGVFAGGAIAVALLASHRGDSKSEMPYAPFLCLGALVALLYNPVPWLVHRLIGH